MQIEQDCRSKNKADSFTLEFIKKAFKVNWETFIHTI